MDAKATCCRVVVAAAALLLAPPALAKPEYCDFGCTTFSN